jgi:hypothetical protein
MARLATAQRNLHSREHLRLLASASSDAVERTREEAALRGRLIQAVQTEGVRAVSDPPMTVIFCKAEIRARRRRALCLAGC